MTGVHAATPPRCRKYSPQVPCQHSRSGSAIFHRLERRGAEPCRSCKGRRSQASTTLHVASGSASTRRTQIPGTGDLRHSASGICGPDRRCLHLRPHTHLIYTDSQRHDRVLGSLVHESHEVARDGLQRYGRTYVMSALLACYKPLSNDQKSCHIVRRGAVDHSSRVRKRAARIQAFSPSGPPPFTPC